jgi:hypothetical protein
MSQKVSFPDIKTYYSFFMKEYGNKTIQPNEFYYHEQCLYSMCQNLLQSDSESYELRLIAEEKWYLNERPYYKIYPSGLKAFENTHCNVSPELIEMPYTCFAVKLPLEANYHESNFLKPLWFFVSKEVDCHPLMPKEYIYIFVTSYDEKANRIRQFCEYIAIDHYIERQVQQILITSPMLAKCIRTAFGVMFCATGAHKVLEYDVLSKHLDAYRKLKGDDTKERNKYRQLTKKKGRNGWSIGRDGRKLSLPNGITPPSKKGSGSRKLRNSFLRGAHWRRQACGPKWSKHKYISIRQTVIRPDLPPLDIAG